MENKQSLEEIKSNEDIFTMLDQLFGQWSRDWWEKFYSSVNLSDLLA